LSNPFQNTICALSSPPGKGAIALIRVTGVNTFTILSKIFSKNLLEAKGNTIHFGVIIDSSFLQNNILDSSSPQNDKKEIVDEVLVSIFRAPLTYTGEDLAEISCHASPFIIRKILSLLMANGCEAATPGEFTMRAFMNKKMDLSQAEAVADLISSQSEAAHKLAMQQVRGGFSKEISALREQLIHFASMLELELDFAEEDVEFADRTEFLKLIDKLISSVKKLADSFEFGNVIKNGIPVAIIGVPNVGKSTLLNSLLNENRALVSEIAGTTRDTIEDIVTIKGVDFRFIDTAGLRETKDVVENMGIERTYDKIKDSSILLYLIDGGNINKNDILKNTTAIQKRAGENKKLWVIFNKSDLIKNLEQVKTDLHDLENVMYLSAKENFGVEELKDHLYEFVQNNSFAEQELVVTNARHHAALTKALESLSLVKEGMQNKIPGDLLAVDIRKTLYHLGEITGEISTDDLLGNIFSKFCIGK
jgi:tRNA modification GTPase